MQVGDRVMVKDGVELYGGRYGYATEQHDHKEAGFKVMLDGDRRPIPFATSELLPVEVVVLDGEQRWDERGCRWYIGDTSLDDHLDNNGDTVRLTIERVKKEG